MQLKKKMFIHCRICAIFKNVQLVIECDKHESVYDIK